MDDRPSVRAPHEARRLADAEAPDFLESKRVAVLAFLDLSQEASERVAERLARIAVELEGRAAFGWLDVRSDPLVAKAVAVQKVPQILVFQGGVEVDRILGAPPDDVIARTVRERLRAAGGND